MLFLLFQLGDDRYALASDQVAEVLPLLRMKQIPLMPAGVAGVLNYHGVPVPVIDLSQLTLGRPAARRMSTRTILVHYGGNGDDGASPNLLGLVAEKVTDTVRLDADDFTQPGIDNPDTPYLGPVVADAGGLIQWIEPGTLLPATVIETLFRQVQHPTTLQPEA